MSYILDALRRADAEREAGSVPGLHTHAAPEAGSPRAARRAPPWAWLGLVAAGVLALALGWVLFAREAAHEAPLAVPAVPPPPAAAAPIPQPEIQPPALAAAPARPTLPAPSAAPAAPPPAPRAVSPHAAAAAPKAVAHGAPAAPASAADGAPAVVALKDLPDDVRRALPALSLGGSIYSNDAASRFLIVNGQLFHEGDALTPELTLRQIKLKSAVLEFRGYRYEIAY